MSARLSRLATLVVVPLALACGTRGGLSFEQFVNTTVQLRLAADQAKTPAAFAARKQAVQGRLGVSDAQLRDFVQRHRTDMKLMSAAWDSVEARLGRASQKDAATRPTPQPQATTSPGAPAPVVPPAQAGPDARGSGAAVPPAIRPNAAVPPTPARPAPRKAVRF